MRLCLPPGERPGEVTLVLFREGMPEHFVPLEGQGWTLRDGREVWEGGFSLEETGLYFYYFRIGYTQGYRYVKNDGAGRGVWENGDLFQLTVYAAGFETPRWLEGGVIYQIFPDRFAKEGECLLPSYCWGRHLRNDWGGTPEWTPDEKGKFNQDYFGGNLLGIIEKLDYLQSLSVTCIYLNPICEAHENHRYTTADYLRVDPLLGTQEDFRALCVQAHQHGIRIILDGVFNHTGADSVYFNREGRYSVEGAYQSRHSPYYPWYSFTRYPDEYACWWGITTVPSIRRDCTTFQDFICGEGGVLDFWLSLGADGVRIDVADELSDEFLDRIRERVKAHGDCLVLGEVWEDASNKVSYGQRRRYLQGAQLDSVMNYPFRDAVFRYVREREVTALRESVEEILENYPPAVVRTLMNPLSTHDTVRALTRLGDAVQPGMPKEAQAVQRLYDNAYCRARALFLMACCVQYVLPGVPSIYYGDEAGLQGGEDPLNRACYPWGHEDERILDAIRVLGEWRRSNREVFAQGDCHIHAQRGGMVIRRAYGSKRVYLFVRKDSAVIASACKDNGGRTVRRRKIM